MNTVAKFEKVSLNEFRNDVKDTFGDRYTEEEIEKIWERIELPVRATKGSAGYDFKTPFTLELYKGKPVKVPTGIRAKIDDGWVLAIFPRSGLGFKYRLRLNNTVGIIDSDYYGSDNEGHIFIKVSYEGCPDTDGLGGKPLVIDSFKAFAQGIFLPYGITEDDDANGTRNGGFGSTNV